MGNTKGIVFIVDDDASVRRSLARLLRSSGFDHKTFASAEEFLDQDPSDPVGCIILDLKMSRLSGLDLQKRLDAAGCRWPIIFLTGHGDIDASVNAMKLGAHDFLTKPADDDRLLAAVQDALKHSEQTSAVAQVEEVIRSRMANLTPRENDVMRAVISGKLNKQIADSLGIVESTVKLHRGQVMKKMAAASVADLVRDCAKVGVAPSTPD